MGDEPKSDSNFSEQDSSALGLAAGFLVGGGRFSLTRELGRGGMSVVWLAHDERLNESVALKFLPAEVRADNVALSDMRRETQKSRRLAHPNIVRIHDLYEAPGEPAFISMEFIEGPNLSDLRLQQPQEVFSWEYLKPLIKQLCDALDYAHGEQIIHRDLKPANMMLDGKGRLKLADFGIAAVAVESTSRATGRHAASGTITHMSPQQLDGKISRVSDDIYALGVTLYELLTSRPPFFTGDLAYQLRNLAAPPVAERLGELKIQNPIPRDVAAMIMACLSKSPESRPESARAVAEWIGLSQTTTTQIQKASSVVAPGSPAEVRPPTRYDSTALPVAEIAEEIPVTPVAHEPEVSSTSPTPRKFPWILAMIGALTLLGAVGWFGRNYFFSRTNESRTNNAATENNSAAPLNDSSPAETYQPLPGVTFNSSGPGSLDTSLDPGIGPGGGGIRAIAVQEDGKILVGGEFKKFNDMEGGFFRLNSDGTLDRTKIPQIRGDVHAIVQLPDRKILIAGSFPSVSGTPRRSIARLNPDLTVDASFDAGGGPSSEIRCLAVAHEKIFAGGNFTKFNGLNRNRFVCLNSNGTIDSAYDEGVNRVIWQIAVQSSGGVLIAGEFDSVHGQWRGHMARFGTNGKIDPGFVGAADGSIHAMAIQPDGKILIGGDFSSVKKTGRSRIARLNADGSLDESFNPRATINKGIRALALQGDGKIIIGGVFTEIGGTPHQSIARLNADGSVDESFAALISSVVRKVAVQRDGKILAAGAFAGANNQPRHSLARFNSSGAATKAAVKETGGNWKILFDGSSTAAWRGYNQDAFPSGAWKIENGALKAMATISAAERCDLITRATFTDFELELEWRAAPTANSGIFYRAIETPERISSHAPEMQLIGAEQGDNKNPITSAGALYGLIAPESSNLNPETEFNQARVVVRGKHVEHWLNGEKVVDYTWGSPEMNSVVAGSKWKVAHVMQSEGHIALQQNVGEIWFRNIRIRELANDKSAAPRATMVLTPSFMASLSVSVDLGANNRESGLRQVEDVPDGPTIATNVLNQPCRLLFKPVDRQAHIYFKVDPTFKRAEAANYRVVVDFYDALPGGFDVDYDAADRKKKFTTAGKKTLTGEHAWKTEEFHLKQARFRGAENGADFRVRSWAREVFIRKVTLVRE